jgi:hypothetical protein
MVKCQTKDCLTHASIVENERYYCSSCYKKKIMPQEKYELTRAQQIL